jgi:PAS domain S-box-containing protein
MANQSTGEFPSPPSDDHPSFVGNFKQSPDLIDMTDGVIDRKRAEHALRENEERFRTLFELAPVAVYSCDAWGVIRDYNNRASELWGRKPQLGDTDEQFCGSFKLYRPDGSYMPHEQCPMGDVLTGKVAGIHDAEVHIERPDGSRIIVIVNIAPLKDDRGDVTGAINCFYDVTERKQAEEVLRDGDLERRRMEEALRDSETRLRLANDELESVVQERTIALRHLSARLMRVQDEERRRIARNLHDSLGQDLATVKMNLDTLSHSATTAQAELLSAALESVERSIVETRTLSFLLHPPLLDEVGFASAARWFTDEFAKRSGIEVRLDLPDGIDRLPELAEIALFRILQESLTNVHRHSGSSRVHIDLTREKQRLTLTVRDFGSGLPVETLAAFQRKSSNGGVGLAGMRERVNDLGGQFEIRSNEGGTMVLAAIPVATEEHYGDAS